MKPIKVKVNDKMQKGYVYYRTKPIGRCFDQNFNPELAPKEVLVLGAFGGVYMRDCTREFPSAWFKTAKFARGEKDPSINYFGVDASMPLSYWVEKGWIHEDDPRGWFQWYCRYYMGRRHEDDTRQINRWAAMRRHVAQVINNCPAFSITCRPKQRQALLHWAYDSRKM